MDPGFLNYWHLFCDMGGDWINNPRRQPQPPFNVSYEGRIYIGQPPVV